MKKSCFNVIGVLCMILGALLVIFNIPSYAWLILLGVALLVTGIFLIK